MISLAGATPRADEARHGVWFFVTFFFFVMQSVTVAPKHNSGWALATTEGQSAVIHCSLLRSEGVKQVLAPDEALYHHSRAGVSPGSAWMPAT